MTQFLPPNLLALFAPRDPLPYLPPLDKLPFEKKNSLYTGVGGYLIGFENPKDTPEPVSVESKDERLERKRREKAEQIAYKLEQGIALWEPLNNPNATSDPFKTLFVARINYDSTESKLRREFETYGPVRKINVVHNRENGKPRGYAFIEYEHERDMHSALVVCMLLTRDDPGKECACRLGYFANVKANYPGQPRVCLAAYKHADGKKIDGRRVLVDVERARTVKGWLPRRLGGGLGGTRRGGPDVNVKHSGREELRSAVGGGSSGGGAEERERERPRRSRSRTPIQRERRRRSRSRSRDRERRRDRKRRSSHERSRDKDRDRDGVGVEDALGGDVSELEDRKDRIEKRRSRSRDRGERERKRSKRSHSRSRDRGDRADRSERKRRDRGDRDSRRDRGGDRDAYGEKPVQIKEEPMDDGYENNGNSGGEYGNNDNDDSYGYSGSQYDDYSRDGTNDAGQYNNYYSATGVKNEPEPSD